MNNCDDKTECSLLDTVYRCVKCNSLAFEYELNKFRCSDILNCDTEWEIIEDV
jgi:hypothetical protein